MFVWVFLFFSIPKNTFDCSFFFSFSKKLQRTLSYVFTSTMFVFVNLFYTFFFSFLLFAWNYLNLSIVSENCTLQTWSVINEILIRTTLTYMIAKQTQLGNYNEKDKETECWPKKSQKTNNFLYIFLNEKNWSKISGYRHHR